MGGGAAIGGGAEVGVTDFAVAGDGLGADGVVLNDVAFGSEVFGSAAGAAFGVVDAAEFFLYEFIADADDVGFSAGGSDFFSASGFFAESVTLIERTWSFWTTANP